jgi:5-dehydro-2-deoxygluconokinase
LHWTTTRARRYEELTVLAIDHRSQFEDLAEEFEASDAQISSFKSLALRAVDSAAAGDERFGVLLDGRYGFDALAQAADRPYWIGRPIEIPRSRPVRFVGSADVATELNEWPINQVVKCLVHYHPEDPHDLRERQERQLLRLFDACRKTRHELLLEVILPADPPMTSTTVARAIRRLNSIGVRPDWWKLEPAVDPAAWGHIEAAIKDGDPHCRGVVMLGLSAPEAELIGSFEAAAPFEIVKGFAVGRTIFFDTAREWLANAISDEQAVADLASKLTRLVDAWRRARGRSKAVA